MKNGKPYLIPSIISAVMLLLALADWPYGYYILLRFVVCGSAAFVAYLGYFIKKQWVIWTFGIIALLFNPIIRIHLNRELWAFIDIAVAVIFIVNIFAIGGKNV
ncbi:MAG: DUF6804 family protein [Sedimentisphaerales bacterium]